MTVYVFQSEGSNNAILTAFDFPGVEIPTLTEKRPLSSSYLGLEEADFDDFEPFVTETIFPFPTNPIGMLSFDIQQSSTPGIFRIFYQTSLFSFYDFRFQLPEKNSNIVIFDDVNEITEYNVRYETAIPGANCNLHCEYKSGSVSLFDVESSNGGGGGAVIITNFDDLIAALKQNYIDNPMTGEGITRIVGPLP